MAITRKDVASAFALLSAAGVRTPKSHEDHHGLTLAVDLWVTLLADLTATDLVVAVGMWARSPRATSTWWPTPGALLELLDTTQRWSEPLEAWAFVLETIRKPGIDRRAGPPKDYWPTESFEVAIAAAGGWAAINNSTDDDMGIRAAFRDAYRGAYRREAAAMGSEQTRRLIIQTAGIEPRMWLGGA